MKLPEEAIEELRLLYLDIGIELTEKQLQEEARDLLRLKALSLGQKIF